MTDDQTWADFRLATFGEPYYVWHDGASFETLLEEWHRDPEHVERMLLAGLGEGDSLAAASIRELPLDEAAGKRLIAALEKTPSGGSLAVEIGQTMAHLTGDQSHSAQVAAVLDTQLFWNDKIDAARAIARFTPTIPLIEALERSLLDPQYLVRYHSANSLLAFGGDPAPNISAMPEEFGVVVDGEQHALEALRDELGAAARARLT